MDVELLVGRLLGNGDLADEEAILRAERGQDETGLSPQDQRRHQVEARSHWLLGERFRSEPVRDHNTRATRVSRMACKKRASSRPGASFFGKQLILSRVPSGEGR